MLTRSGRLAFVLAIAASCLVGPPAFAAEAAANAAAPPAPSIIVLDFDRLLQESKAGKSVSTQIQQRFASYQKSFSQQEAELNSAQQELGRQQSILAQDAFSAKVRDLEKRTNELREKEQQANVTLSHSRDESVRRIQQVVRQILDDIMKERGANVVVNRAAVILIGDDRFDVTEDTLKRLDEKLPNLTVSFNEAAAPAGQNAAPAKPAASSKKK